MTPPVRPLLSTLILCAMAWLSSLPGARLVGADTPWTMVLSPDNSFNVWILKDGQPLLSTGSYGWGPGWSGFPGPASLSATTRGSAGTLECIAPWFNFVGVALHARATASDTVTYQYLLATTRARPVMMLETGFLLTPAAQHGSLVLTAADGSETTTTLPWPRVDLLSPQKIRRIRFDLTGSGAITVDISPACRLHHESNNLRVALIADRSVPGAALVTLTYHFPGAVTYLTDDQAVQSLIKPLAGPDWFPLTVKTDPAALAGVASITDMSSWLDAPAGKHGGVRMVGDHFECADGTHIKFWGTNLAYAGACAPSKPWAEATAARFARQGINGVRLHKFTEPAGAQGISDPNDATQYLAAGMDRLDYMCAQLKSRGIYFGMSHTFGFTVQPGNRDQLLDYDEIRRNAKGNTYALINYAEDVQRLMISRVVTLLNHVNPYTKLRLADEPALAYIELQNEDDIFFWSTAGVTDEARWPSYTTYLKKRFATWLTARYATQAALATAWAESLKPGETLTAGTIHVQGNPWFFTTTNLQRISVGERRRMLDNAAFFHAIQDQFYSAFTAAIRATGYQGPLCGSPWQAPAMLPCYDNLASDAQVGYIDRHNYFDGGVDGSMMASPGSGTFSTGLQQVVDRPFGVSEWVHVYPTLHSAEGPAIFAAYGLGLQGWDASYEFQSSSGLVDYSGEVGHGPWGVWNADLPNQLGQAPTLARMIYRGDVQEGAVISTRTVAPADLASGTFTFDDEVSQHGDIKTFSGSCPPAALAAGRCVVAFTPTTHPSTFPDMGKYTTDGTITSTTGQLRWNTTGQGYFTVDTPGTKGVVGFAQGVDAVLGAVSVHLDSAYASLFVTATAKDATLATGSSAILSAVARESNSGCTYFTIDHHIISNGGSPVLIEPVKATIRFSTRTITAVHVLDQDGVRTAVLLPVTGGAFTIDGAVDHAFYYEIDFQQ